MVCLVFFPFLSSLQVVVFWKRFMSASLSEVVKTVLMFIFLSTWKTTCLNVVILDHHFSLWHLVPYWETVKATLFFILDILFLLGLKNSFFIPEVWHNQTISIHRLLFIIFSFPIYSFMEVFTHFMELFFYYINLQIHLFSVSFVRFYISGSSVTFALIDYFCLSSVSITLYLII